MPSGEKIYTSSEYVLNGFFLHSFVPGAHESFVWAGWTIGVEMIFYAIFPLVLACVTSLRAAFIFFLLSCFAGSAFASMVASLPALPQGYGYMGFPRALPSFAAGVLAFHVFRYAVQMKRPPSLGLVSVSAGSILVVAIGVRVAGASINNILLSMAFGALCVWQALFPGKILSSAAMRYVGERSYSIYLVHAVIIFRLAPVYAVFYETFPLPVAFVASLVLALCCVFVVASLTYKFIEEPFIRLGARLASGTSSTTTRAPKNHAAPAA